MPRPYSALDGRPRNAQLLPGAALANAGAHIAAGRGWGDRHEAAAPISCAFGRLWDRARARFGKGGRFLFGTFSAAEHHHPRQLSSRFITYRDRRAGLLAGSGLGHEWLGLQVCCRGRECDRAVG